MIHEKFTQKTAFVGLGGTHNTVNVVHLPDRIVCRLAPWAYAVVLLATALFGPGLLTLLWLRPPGTIDLAKQPVTLAALILAIPLISCVLFVHYLFTQHRLEINRETRALRFYKRLRGKPIFVLPRDSILRLATEESWYRPSRGAPVRNLVLRAFCRDDKSFALCISTDEALIKSLANELHSITGAAWEAG